MSTPEMICSKEASVIVTVTEIAATVSVMESASSRSTVSEIINKTIEEVAKAVDSARFYTPFSSTAVAHSPDGKTSVVTITASKTYENVFVTSITSTEGHSVVRTYTFPRKSQEVPTYSRVLEDIQGILEPSEGSSEGTPEGTPEGSSKGTPEGTSKETPEGTPEGSPRSYTPRKTTVYPRSPQS